MTMVKTAFVIFVLAGSASAFRQNVQRVAEEVAEASRMGVDGILQEVDNLQMMSMMAGSVQATGVNERSGKMSQKLASGILGYRIQSRKGVEGIKVYRTSDKSQFRGQTSFQTILNFRSAAQDLDTASTALIPLLKEQIETEMELMNEEHKNCKYGDRTSCKFVVCTYVGTTAELGGHHDPAALALGLVDAGELMTGRAASILGSLQDLKDVDEDIFGEDNIEVDPVPVTYGGVTRFVAVMLKVYGSTRPPCEESDMNPLTADQGEQVEREAKRVLQRIAEEGPAGGSQSGGDSENDFLWLDHRWL